MRFPPHLLDEIRARLPVSVVVGRRVKLIKAGREYKGLSPFQQEKTPSFYVNDQKGFYHCFSSGKHGDIFRFVMETEGLAFPEAVERLAREAGVELPKATPEAQQEEKKRRDLYDVMELAAKFFEAQLQRGPGETARAYLAKRGFVEKTQAEFRMGFAPDSRDALKSHMAALGVTEQQMLDAGLLVEPERGGASYDRFRNRVIIPIQDTQGRVVAFGGRVLDAEAKPKYLNSPETSLFRKGFLVFNGHRAREAAFKAGTVIAVEGYLDAIAVWQAGLRHVVATLGTAFTEEQIATLWRFAPEPVISFDGDKAGVAAANRAVDRILPQLKTGNSFRFSFLPAGLDPDDMIRQRGVDAFADAANKALPLWDVLWRRESEGQDVTTPDRQAMLEKRLRDLIQSIGDPLVRRRYELSARLRLNQLFYESSGSRRTGPGGQRDRREKPRLSAESAAAAGGDTPRHIAIERIFLGLSLHYPDLLERHHERIASLRLRGFHKSTEHGSTGYDRFLSDLLRALDEAPASSASDLYARLDPYFLECLEDLHGTERARQGLPWGHKLQTAFPILKSAPGEIFIERCYDHFIRMLELREAEIELASLLNASPEQMSDDWAERMILLKRDVEADQAAVNRADQDLAEFAAEAKKFADAQGTNSWAADLALPTEYEEI
jgi:DNA primase